MNEGLEVIREQTALNRRAAEIQRAKLNRKVDKTQSLQNLNAALNYEKEKVEDDEEENKMMAAITLTYA